MTRSANVTGRRDPNGNETTYQYDARDRLIETTLPVVEDEWGHLIDGASITQTYDAAGQRIAETDTLGRVTRYQYDDAGRLTSIQLPNAGEGRPTTTLRYDAVGNLTARIDPLGNVTTFHYDARNRPIHIQDPDPDPTNATTADVSETVYEFDALGRLVRKAAPEGRVTEYHYDDLSRLIETRHSDPDAQVGRRSAGRASRLRPCR